MSKIQNLQEQDAAASERALISELEVKCQEYLSGWQRARADYENLQKETAKKTEALGNFIKANLLLEILPIYDDYKLALQHLPQEHQATKWASGFFHIKKEFEQFLKSAEVEEIKTIGQQFNPELHEAVSSEASAEATGQIIKEIRAGYQFKDEVIRPSQVVVSQGNHNIEE